MLSFLTVPLLLAAAAFEGVSARSAGCGKTPITSGQKSINVNGQNRQYQLQLPNNYDSSKEHMLIFGLHWLGGNMNNVHPDYYGLRNLAGNNAIFVAPNGLDNGWANPGGRDTAFIDAVIRSVENDLCVDESLRFSTGFSFGGGMSYSLACNRADVFRAVAPIAAGQISGCDGGNDPIAYLGIHGTNDNVLPISGGRGLRDRFIRNNGCQAKNAPEPGNGQSQIKTEYSCREGYPVTWIAFSGGHDFSAGFIPGEIWSFFSQFSSGGGGSPPPDGGNQPPPPGNGGGGGGNCAAMWGQCGGQGWTGATCCSSGTCRAQNQWYSQCV